VRRSPPISSPAAWVSAYFDLAQLKTITSVSELRSALGPLRAEGKSIGFVPTMGALHAGHLSLVELSRFQTDVTIVSIFVNPTQFGPNEDFSKYPRTLEDDTQKLTASGVDFLFLPQAEDIYPAGASTSIHVGEVTELFEGAIRPTHFDGVATVVTSLFNIVQPDLSFFGQKDAQQVAVIKRMVRDLHIPVRIVVGETTRESDGLAMSSRNRYLSPSDRSTSLAVFKALTAVRDCLGEGVLIEKAKDVGFKEFSSLAPEATLDYLDIVDSETFRPATSFDAARTYTIVIAARFGTTRLIDNLVIGPST
jgi:pantoate--beta-alanine ligase